MKKVSREELEASLRILIKEQDPFPLAVHLKLVADEIGMVYPPYHHIAKIAFEAARQEDNLSYKYKTFEDFLNNTTNEIL